MSLVQRVAEPLSRAGSPMSRSGRSRLLVAGAAALALTASACNSDSSSGGGASEISIGISVPLTGSVGSSCGPMNQAMTAWIKHVNDTGGVNGKQIKVDNRDDGYDAARAVTNTKAFLAEKVVAVTGQCGSTQPPAQVPLLASSKTPFLFTFGASTKLLDPLNPWYFNLMPSYGSQLVQLVPYVFQKQGPGTAVVMASTTPDSVIDTKNVEDAVRTAGGTVLGDFSAPPGTADLSPYVLKIKALHPDYVILDQTPQDAARLTKAMTANQFAPNKNFIGSNAISQATFLSTVDPALAPKLIVASDTLVPAAAGSTQCASVLKAANLDVEGVTLRGCGTAQVLVKLLGEIKGDITGQSIANQLETWSNVNASEIYQPLSFSKTNHVGVSSLYVFGVKNGAFYQLGTVQGS